ncbi:sugar ABC transporter substrate-binding protein [Microtetraspora sp. NBRC 13810]|uniref:extracellular solute-binding protein n=1 Tax=Microtetraspora sp. NBRC 13810 TaxID=3030990 RepID=UPI0024A38B9E|nr:extracellular solute-binding protein [Microtetraspora sp. NBRC 13810]GLW08134.1 sugar ABC transporter substrate-binding protein [Microtetraspora sp. NBRC 13810]
MNNHVTRRTVLRGSLGAVAGLALAGCGGGVPAVPLADNSKVRMPDHVPYAGVRPAFPGTEEGVLNGYLHYPGDPVVAFPGGPPAKGEPISVMTLIYNPVPPPASRNGYWQALNRSLGTELRLEIVPIADYPTKVPVVIAGGDLPDAMCIRPEISQRPALLHALFQDLSEHLSGPAIREYPYLANIPPQCWRSTVYNGGIYGLPMPRANVGSVMFYRADRMRERSLDPRPADFAEFRRLCADLADPRRSRYALGDPLTTVYFLMEMLGGPNFWREDGGRFTYWLETEEIRQALDAARQLARAGLFHPDAFTVLNKFKDWFGSGQIALHYDGNSGWNDFYRLYAQNTPGFAIDGMLAPGFDGGPGTHWSGVSSFAFLSLKKAPRERIRQILRACDALAAPFGTDAYKLRKYGVQGVDHTLQGSDPLLTPTGKVQTTVPTIFVTDAPQSLYFPENPAVVPLQHAFQKRALDVLVTNPAEGMYSETDVTTGPTLLLRMNDELKGVVQGRVPLSSWDATVRTWRREGGDRMRAEYERYWESSRS